MSQHHIRTKLYDVIVGWDRPLQSLFGIVWDKTQLDSGGEAGIVFASLSIPEGGVDTVAELARLLRLYIELPPQLIEVLSEDRLFNRGNAFSDWTLEDDTWKLA